MTRDEMTSLIERLCHLWSTDDLSEIENLYTPEFIGHFPGSPLGDLKGQSGVRDAIKRVRRAFPNWTETVEDIIVEGDKAVTRYISTGVQKGSFFDLPPTGERVRYTEISIFRMENGRVAEQWCLFAPTA